MKKTITIDVCDYCEAEIPGDEPFMLLTLGSKQFTSALCQSCLDDIETELRQVLGKALTETTKVKTTAKAKSRSKTGTTCVPCGKTFNTEQGLKIHNGRHHKS